MGAWRPFTVGLGLLGALALVSIWTSGANAYKNYNGCAKCHGGFRSSPYVSLSDGSKWGDSLHNLHRYSMLSGDCSACHQPGGRTPVSLDFSTGTDGLDTSCIGCHGRDGEGGAGLRQHHWNAGKTTCGDCHPDSDPFNFTPAGEDLLPPYYSDPPTKTHPDAPTDPCNPVAAGFPEDYAGSSIGLDNDGDLIYDEADPDCVEPAPTPTPASEPTPTPTPAVTPTPSPTAAIQGEITMKIQLKFNKPSKDKISVLVKNWALPASVIPTNVTVDVGGASFNGMLDAKGKFKSLDGHDAIKMSQSRRTQLWKITVKRKNSAFAANLEDEGLTDANNPTPGLRVTVPLTIEVGGASYNEDVNLFYTSKIGKKGTGK